MMTYGEKHFLSTLKVLIRTAGDNILIDFFFCIFYNIFKKIRFDVSCETSAQQTIFIKCQVLFLGKEQRNKEDNLTFTTLRAYSADDKLRLFFLYFQENRI